MRTQFPESNSLHFESNTMLIAGYHTREYEEEEDLCAHIECAYTINLVIAGKCEITESIVRCPALKKKKIPGPHVLFSFLIASGDWRNKQILDAVTFQYFELWLVNRTLHLRFESGPTVIENAEQPTTSRRVSMLSRRKKRLRFQQNVSVYRVNVHELFECRHIVGNIRNNLRHIVVSQCSIASQSSSLLLLSEKFGRNIFLWF